MSGSAGLFNKKKLLTSSGAQRWAGRKMGNTKQNTATHRSSTIWLIFHLDTIFANCQKIDLIALRVTVHGPKGQKKVNFGYFTTFFNQTIIHGDLAFQRIGGYIKCCHEFSLCLLSH